MLDEPDRDSKGPMDAREGEGGGDEIPLPSILALFRPLLTLSISGRSTLVRPKDSYLRSHLREWLPIQIPLHHWRSLGSVSALRSLRRALNLDLRDDYPWAMRWVLMNAEEERARSKVIHAYCGTMGLHRGPLSLE